MISFRILKKDIDNNYDPHSRAFVYGSSMIEVVDFTFSYARIGGMIYLCIIFAIAYSERLTIFVLDISNSIRNSILTNLEEIAYLTLPHLYLKWFKIKWLKYPLPSIDQK